ncbi:methyltransferase domain-containing protein [archaeon]|jgi:arsenite methyltransferase|nr:methyltransferase domain-containing protein [archaeon]MBT6762291.1 methyltransferase domain-containing protein [archaeon]
MEIIEFNQTRALLYEKAMTKYPNARVRDLSAMLEHLEPNKSDRILGFGEGNGYFCQSIANRVGVSGKYLVTDPSNYQLAHLVSRLSLPQVEIKQIGVEGLSVEPSSFDKVWSFGAFHHSSNKAEAMKRIYSALDYGGKMVVCDVFQGSVLAKHFDDVVAKYCVTGHDVEFLSNDSAKYLCKQAGFKDSNIQIIDLPQKWLFRSESGLGEFIYQLHALTNLPGNMAGKISQTVDSCRNILGVESVGAFYELNWPMSALIAYK